MIESMITTIDNPYSPFDEFDQWRAWDEHAGYNTLSLLARVAITSPDLSDADQSLAMDEAINEMLEFNVTGAFIKVTRDVKDQK